jgi:hypothetical protein
VTAARLQFQHHLRETLVRHLVAKLLFMRLRNLVVLTIDAAKVAVAEEDVARASGPDERRFLAEVGRVRRDDREAAGVTCGDLVVEPIVQAIARANGAPFEQPLELRNAPRQRAVT